MRQIGLKARRDSRRRRGASHMARRLCVVCRAVQAVNGQPWPSFQPDLWSQVSTRVSSHCALHVIREGTKDFFFISHKTCVIDIGIEEAAYVREVLPVKTGQIPSMQYVPILFNCLRSVRFGSVQVCSLQQQEQRPVMMRIFMPSPRRRRLPAHSLLNLLRM